MQLIITEDHLEMSHRAAEILSGEVSGHAINLVPATGNTPMDCYAELARMAKDGSFDSSKLRIIQLDEYVGIPADDERSLYGWMARSLIDPLNIPPERIISFRTAVSDAESECREFDQRVIAAGGVQIAVLGLGPNGHLGYNEPPSDAESPTRVVPLTEDSLISAAAYFGGRDRVPTYGMTLGMNHILAADHILLLVSGAHKREMLHRTLHGPITPDLPASFLRQAARVTVLADRAAMPDGTES